ncbi:hypothetical protein [Glaciibacter sp. 2TAF33]|uniref:hypothetical protein n=1 Tax=Glaciibacter sp. 2TAF33 TaxID=3233015 RepID=UPI003F90F144
MNADDTNADETNADEMTADEKRVDQLSRAPKSDPGDAAPRIDVTESADGPTRIDVRDDAVVRPGGSRAGTDDRGAEPDRD